MTGRAGDVYRTSGVDYEVLDAAKRRSLEAVVASLDAPRGRGAEVVAETVGEPAQCFSVDGVLMATVLECLGTKSEIARQVEELTGEDHWEAIGTDAVAAILNDLCCVGAVPLTVSCYLATGSASWYDSARHASFVTGWATACAKAGAAWVGGESPSLAGIISDSSADVAGSAVGRVPAGTSPWLGSRLRPGDEIVLVNSSGLHANGASLARKVAEQSPGGWTTELESGASLASAVLAPSVSYVGLVEALQGSSLAAEVHYASHVTGHGLRKLMRSPAPLSYRVTSLPEVPEVLSYLSEHAALDMAAAYGTFNMGVGFALYSAKGTGDAVAELANGLGFQAAASGVVAEGEREVVLAPLGIRYGSSDLELR